MNILEPSEDSLRKVIEAAEETGDLEVLSEADIELLALALELNATVVTNDFAVQNVAEKLGLEWEGIGKSIRRFIQWEWYCPGCKRVYERKGKCEFCGLELKRRPKSLK